MGDADVLNAVMNATEGLLCKLQVAQQTQPNFIAAGPAVRQFAILMANPLLLEPQYHKQARVRAKLTRTLALTRTRTLALALTLTLALTLYLTPTLTLTPTPNSRCCSRCSL